MAQQITNNSLIQDSLLASTNFADASANQFDSILSIANKSVLKQNANDTTALANTSGTDKTSLSLNAQNSSTTTQTTQFATDLNTTKLNQNSSKNEQTTTTSNSSSAQVDTVNVIDTQVVEPVEKDVVIKNIAQEQVTDNNEVVEDSSISDEELTAQVETLIQTYAMNKIDLSAIKLHFPESLEIDETDVDLSALDNIELEVDNIIDETALDTEIDADTLVDVDENIDVNTDILNLNEDTDVNIDSTTKADFVNSQDVLDATVITPVSINLTSDAELSLPVDTNNIMLNVSNEVEPLQESYFLPKEKPVENILTQDMVDELNITVEDVNISNVQNEETTLDNSLTDSMEQVVKYSMEQADKESQPDTKISYNDNKIEQISYEETVESGVVEVDNEELADTKKDVIKDSDKDVTLDDVEQSDEIVSEDVDYSFTDDEFTSNSEADSDTEVFAKQTEKEIVRDVKKGYAEVETVQEEPVANDNTSSNIVGENHLGLKGVSSPTTVSASTQTFASTNVTKEDVIAQIHAKLQTMNSHTNTKLTMVLNPESLGKVTIQLANTKNGMVAEMLVASQTVKDILDSNLSGLKDTLTAQGVQVNEVSVKVSESENNAEMDYTEQEGSESGKGEQGKKQHQKEKDENKFEKMFSDIEQKNKN